jgi:hypothetical protein
MSFANEDYQKFYHVARHAELIQFKDRDVVAFVPELLPIDAESGMQISLGASASSGSTSPFYTSADDVVTGERALLYARLSQDSIVNGFRWVPYITTENPDGGIIKPFREVYSPRVTYDKTANVITMWFWTNVNLGYNGSSYSESQIVPMNTKGLCDRVTFDDDDEPSAKRVLCTAVGSFRHAYIEGGSISFTGVTADDPSFDLIPVFTLPKIVTNFETPNATGGPGQVVDGWECQTGIQGGGGGDCTGTTQAVTVVTDTAFDSEKGRFTETKQIIYFCGAQGLISVETVFEATGCTSGEPPDGGLQGPQGPQGPQGVTGATGLDGADGVQGPQGFLGVTGSTGATGAGVQGPQGFRGFRGFQGLAGTGAKGNQGNDGNDGAAGVDGDQGPTGNLGPVGNTGLQGPTGPKLAIVHTESYGYRELYCVEASEVLFIDVADVEITQRTHIFDIDPIFIESCEKGSIRVMGYSCDRPIALGIKIEKGSISVTTNNVPTKATVTLCGVRKGFAGRRFAERTAEEAVRNNAFWDSVAIGGR